MYMRALFLVTYIRYRGNFNTAYEVSYMAATGGFMAAGCQGDPGRGGAGAGPAVAWGRTVRNPPLILTGDDDALLLQVSHALPTGQGYEVVTAPDGQAAVAAARRERPGLPLLDLVMPGLNGMEVCRRVKADPRCPSCRSSSTPAPAAR